MVGIYKKCDKLLSQLPHINVTYIFDLKSAKYKFTTIARRSRNYHVNLTFPIHQGAMRFSQYPSSFLLKYCHSYHTNLTEF